MLERVSCFRNYMRGTYHQFNKLVKIVGPSISKLEMNRRGAALLGEQLGITLSRLLLFNYVKYTRIVLKLIIFYK